MPIDPSTDPATATTRRGFLARSAVGGALVTAGAVASPLGRLLPIAGAQTPTAIAAGLSDSDFAVFATPFELTAVQTYLAAIESDLLDDEWLERARTFQSNHQAVAATLTTLVAETEEPPVADTDLLEVWRGSVEGAADQDALLQVLVEVEESLSATHLAAIRDLTDPITAKTVAQVLTIEAQQAVLLATASGTAIDDVTPGQASTEAALS